MLFLAIQSHTPENCPLNDPNCSPLFDLKVPNVEIKAMYASPPEHKLYFIIETDSYEAIQQMFQSGMTRSSVEIKPIIDLVQHHDHGRFGGEAADHSQPVVGLSLLLSGPSVEHQQVQAAIGEEKLVRGMHDLLSAKIPHVQADVFRFTTGPHVDIPGANLDSLGCVFLT